MMNEDLCTVELWARKWGMFFGDFHITKESIGVDGLGGLQFFSNPMARADDVFLLGVRLDHGLYFNKH